MSNVEEEVEDIEPIMEAAAVASADDPEVEEGEESATPPEDKHYDFSSYGVDFDVAGLVNRVEKGDIARPDFQREYVWPLMTASKFIESLIIGIPVPNVFLATDPVTKKLNIIDGQQRLITLKNFFSGQFSLKGDWLPENLKGRKYVNLPKGREYQLLEDSDRRALENATIRAMVIKQESKRISDGVREIFQRLNTNNHMLTSQEIRACVYHGSLYNLIKELNTDGNWRALFGKPHKRLKDSEIILRFIAFLNLDLSTLTKGHKNPDYSTPMRKFLDDFMAEERFAPDANLSEYRFLFTKTMEHIASLGSAAFKSKTSFLQSRFDAVAYGIATNLRHESLTPDIANAFAVLLKDEQFLYGVEKFVNDADRIQARLEASARIFKA